MYISIKLLDHGLHFVLFNQPIRHITIIFLNIPYNLRHIETEDTYFRQ